MTSSVLSSVRGSTGYPSWGWEREKPKMTLKEEKWIGQKEISQGNGGRRSTREEAEGQEAEGTYLCWDTCVCVCVYAHVCVLRGKEACTSASLST